MELLPTKLKSQLVHVETALALARVLIGLISAGYSLVHFNVRLPIWKSRLIEGKSLPW